MGVPIALAAAVVAASIAWGLDATGVFVASLVGLAAWAIAGGLIVRVRGRWREVLMIAAALTAIVCVAYAIVIFAHSDTDHQNDQIVAVGTVPVALVTLPPFVLLTALGRGFRRTLRGAVALLKRGRASGAC